MHLRFIKKLLEGIFSNKLPYKIEILPPLSQEFSQIRKVQQENDVEIELYTDFPITIISDA